MFEENPFDRWCRSVVEFCILVTLFIELEVRRLWVQLICFLSILRLRTRHLLFTLWKQGGLLCFTCYRRFICVPLMLCGLMRIPTWAEIEAHRLQIIARTGLDIPCPAELERGLQQEKMTRLAQTRSQEQ